jgi:hypothetical protein
LPDEIERGVDVAKDLFMMSGNVCITIRVNRDHHDASALARACRSLGGRRLGRKDEPAAFRHGIARGDRKAEDGRHELARICQYRRDVGGRGDIEINTAERGPQQADRIGSSALSSTSRGFEGRPRAKPSRCAVSAAPRVAALSINLAIAESCGSSATASARMSIIPVITVSTLLKS